MRLFCAYFVLGAFISLATVANSQTTPPEQADHPPSTAAPEAPSEQPQHPGNIVGTVVSVSNETLLVRTDDNRYHLFVFEYGTTRPKDLAKGARIRVISERTDDPGVRLATQILPAEPGAAPEGAPPPKEINDAQRQIEKLARRWQFGVRAGAGLDPELFLIGAHVSVGPIFSKEAYFRPNVEFAFGELTDMFAINLEATYRLPITSREGRWSAYLGAGPSLNFIHQGVDKRDINFSNFNYETGLNVLGGIRYRRGTFAELKTSLWAPGVPTLRMMIGYNF